MKVRTGFVSNSSSSSFMCNLCGAEGSGWDAYPAQFGWATCENWHNICTCCLEEGDNNINVTSDVVDDPDEGPLLKKEKCPVCQMKNVDKTIEAKLLRKLFQMSTDEQIFSLLKKRGVSTYEELKEFLK